MFTVEKYFNAEKSESLLFVVVGLFAIVASLYFLLKVKQPFYNGISYPFILVALIQLTVGISVYLRSPEDIKRVSAMIHSDQSLIQTKEIPRMDQVMKNFVIYRWIEIGLILAGIILIFVFQNGSFLRGVGLGLIIQASFMLLLDYFAERRGVNYLKFLNEFVK